MNFSKFLKVILIILTTIYTLMGLGFFVFVLLLRHSTINTLGFILPLTLGMLGVLSIIFHAKTYKAYSKNFTGNIFPKVSKALWIFNNVNGVLLMFVGLLLFVLLYDNYHSGISSQRDVWMVSVLISLSFVIGVWTVFDADKLRQIKKKCKESQAKNIIDAITGVEED